jgi:hypothetical protein
MKCRHRDSWLIGSGLYEWCYRCGAFRRLRSTGPTSIVDSSWCVPVASGNPWDAWVKRDAAWRKGMATRRAKR